MEQVVTRGRKGNGEMREGRREGEKEGGKEGGR